MGWQKAEPSTRRYRSVPRQPYQITRVRHHGKTTEKREHDERKDLNTGRLAPVSRRLPTCILDVRFQSCYYYFPRLAFDKSTHERGVPVGWLDLCKGRWLDRLSVSASTRTVGEHCQTVLTTAARLRAGP